MSITSLSELKQKEVINLCDGARLGRICDLEIDAECGVIVSIVVPGPPRFWGLIKSDEEIVIPYANIRKIGEDVLLIDVNI